MADEGRELCSEILDVVSSDNKFIQSPFISVKDTALKYLMWQYGTNLFYINAEDLSEENRQCVSSTGNERPRQIVQIAARESDSLLQNIKNLISKLDSYSHVNAINIELLDCKHETEDVEWRRLLQLMKLAVDVSSIPITCKLAFSSRNISAVINRINELSVAGCKKVLLHGRVDTKVVDVLDRTSWESVKIIRNSVKIEDVYVEIVCSSVYEAANFLQYTCVQGIAIAEPLLWNPALYSRCRPATLEVMKQYLHLCKHFSTQLLLAKKSMMQFSGYLLRRFPDLHEHVEMADSVQNLAEVAKELEERLSQLTKNQVKMLGRLQEKKLHYRIRALKQKCRNQAKIKKGSTLYEGPTKRQRKEEQKQRVVDAMANGLRVALDLSLVHKMSKKEIGKVAGQVRRVYGSNMKSSRPVHLHFTGLVKSEAIYQECVRQNQGFEQYMVEKTECSLSDVFAADETIYLTPDSPNVLESLDSRMVYVIGGLVDHTVLKNVTKRKAEVCSLKTARLPLDEYMDMVHSGNHNYSRVLSINQVFDILLKFYETKDWRQALLSGVPARKGFTVKAS